MAAQTIVHETYDEPELAFLKNLAQKLSLTDAYYKDRASLTIKARKAYVFKRGMKGRIIYIACI